MTNQKKGFTLIELLVVIAIIGILSAIGLVSLNGAREKARDAQRKSDIGQMNTALILYYDDSNSTYPAQTADAPATQADCILSDGTETWPTAGAATAADVGGTAGNLWVSGGAMVPNYLSRVLQPPSGAGATAWPNVYCYDTDASTSSYVLYGGLEAGAGDTFFKINADGESATDNNAVPACTAAPCDIS